MKLDLLKCCICVIIVVGSFSCSGKFSSQEKEMYQKLQSIKMADKADESITGFDTLALSLVDYYEKRGSILKLAEVYYYAGRVYFERRDFSKAIQFYNMAVSALPNSDSPDLEGVIYSQSGYVFSLQDLTEEAIVAFRHSYEYYKSQKDTLGMIYGLRDIGKEYSAIGRYEEARNVLQESVELAKRQRLDYMYYGNKSNLASIYCKLHDYKKAKEELGEALTHIYGPDSSGVLATAANIYMTIGMVDSAEYYSKQLLEVGTLYARCAANERLAEIALQREQPNTALHYLLQYKKLNDSIRTTTTTETVAKINALYNYQQQQQENAELRESVQRKNLLLAVASFVILVAAIIFIAAYLYYTKYKETKNLRSEILDQAKKWQQTQEDQALSAHRRKELEECAICKKFYDIANSDMNLVPKIADEEWQELERAINDVYPRFSERLENLCHINTIERRVCLLRKMNMPPTKIAHVLNKSKQAIGSVRDRLYEKAFNEKGTPTLWDKYLDRL